VVTELGKASLTVCFWIIKIMVWFGLASVENVRMVGLEFGGAEKQLAKAKQLFQQV